MTLNDLNQGDNGIIAKVRGRGAFRKRIMEMGFVKGKNITVIKKAPLKDPVEYNIMGYRVTLRRSEAKLIEIVSGKESQKNHSGSHSFNGTIDEKLLKLKASTKGKEIDIAVVGNPNSGKTTIFNHLSKAKGHVGNYSGVTVDQKKSTFKYRDYTFNIVDLPGTYSLSAYTPEELYVRKYILGGMPDIVLNVIDASNIERNLYLTTQLIDMDIKVVVALNMFDELSSKGDKFDYVSLGNMIGIPFVPTIGSKGKGIIALMDKVIEVYEDNEPSVRHIHINYGKDVENAIRSVQSKLWQHKELTDFISSRFYAIKLLERDQGAHFSLSKLDNYQEIVEIASEEIEKIEAVYKEDSESLITDAKYGFIAGALRETYSANKIKPKLKTDSEIIDTFITHKLFGFPIFIFFLWLMFQATFTLGSYPQKWIEGLVGLMGNGLSMVIPDGIMKDLIVDGIIGGVGGVIIFLPNILILFFFISLMEDTGYMARAAFIMDKLMHKMGLHGKSFIPLIMGFGCNVPAIMATRTIPSRNDRLLTMLVNPFMSCSARLPVYILIIGAFFPEYAVTVLFSVYAIGIFLAVGISIVFKKVFFNTEEVPFVMELPPYRMPTFKATLRHMWFKGSQYLKKMGGIILIASVVIWILGYFPKNNEKLSSYDERVEILKSEFNRKIAVLAVGSPEITSLKNIQKQQIELIEKDKEKFRQKNTYIGQIGHFIEPVMRPLGFDWKMSISLLAGVAAKEVVVSTMGVLYQEKSDANTSFDNLSKKLQDQTYDNGPQKGNKVFTKAVAFGFLMFILIYFPCVAVIATIKKESGKWKWALFLIVYTTSLAWVVAFAINQVGLLFS